MTSRLTRRRFMQSTATAALLPLLGGTLPALAQDASNLVVRTDLDIGNLDPANRSNSCDEAILRATMQGLVTFKPGSLDWELDAAKSITQVSDTEITFELNPGQMFTDGYGELTADDVKFTYERYITPDASGALPAYAGDFSALDKVEVTGTYTGRILLKNPAPAFWVLGLCDAGGVILSRKAVEAMGDGIKTKAVGSGPYLLSEWQTAQQIVLSRNPGYTGPHPGSFEKITIKPISDPRAALLSLLAKEVVWSEVETTDEPQVQGVDGIVPFATPRIDYTWIGMNVEKGALADIRVRQAIRLAIDVDMIIAGAYQGTVEPARALQAPSLLGYWADAPAYTRDVAAAQALLAEAGQTGLTLTFTTLNDPTYQATAQIVQANLAEVGINVTINAMDPGAFYAMGADDLSKDLELTLNFFLGKNDPAFQTVWFTTPQIGQWNWQRWSNAEFDQMDSEAAATIDPAVRAEKYVRAQQLMDESAAFVWITHGKFVMGTAAGVTPAVMPAGTGWQFHRFALA